MAAIVTVGANGTVDEDYTHFDQYADTLNAVLGITDTAQDALGRLVLPRGVAYPGSPSEGMAVWRTDLGDNGRLHLRDGAGQWVPYIPLRQVVKSTELAAQVTINSGSLVDVTGLSISITTTGGRLRIWLAPSIVQAGASYLQLGSHASGNSGYVCANAGGVQLGSHQIRSGANDTTEWPCSALVWDYKPAAGTYTVKIQAAITNAALYFGGNANGGIALVVEEWGD